jgi:cyanophycinase
VLALVGSGEYLPPMESVDRELLLRVSPQVRLLRVPPAARLNRPAPRVEAGRPPRVVCLATAAGREGEERIDYWSRLGVDHFQRLGASAESVPVLDTASANNPVLAARIAEADLIYLSGGSPGYLHQTLAGSLAWQAILGVHQAGGVVAGCSAGAMVMSESFIAFPGWKTGFGLLPGVTVIPHFDELGGRTLAVLSQPQRPRLTIVGVERNTALWVDGDHWEVLGSGGVTVWTDSRRVRYTAGPMPRV